MTSRLFRNILFICIGLNLLTIVLILIFQKSLPPVVPLFYGLPVSVDQLVPSTNLIIPSVVSIIISITNFLIAKKLKDHFLEKIFVGIAILTTILAIITTINIFGLVGKL